MALTIDEALRKGVKEHDSGNLQAAGNVYQEILRSYPNHPDANHNLGLIAVSTNQVRAALPLFKAALDVNPKVEQFWVSYIDALIKADQPKEARRAVKKAKKRGFSANIFELMLSQSKRAAVAKVPSQEQLSSLLEYCQNKRFGQAEKLARSLIKLFPRHIVSWQVLCTVLKATGRDSEALVASKNVISINPREPEAYYNLGNTLQKLLRFGEAEESYRKAIRIKPEFAEAYFNLGVTLQGMFRLEEAEVNYTKAIDLKPDFSDALINRWFLLFNRKEYEAALRDAELVISDGVKQYDLTTLYALGEIDEIYKRIEARSKIDGENISIAAFAAFITGVEKRDTAYNFCPYPLDFVHVTNLSSHMKDSVSYATGIIEELANVQTTWEPPGKSTTNGFQTRANINLFLIDSVNMAQLKAIIINELEAYKLKFRNESCSFIKKWPAESDLFGWHVVLKDQGYQSAHIHTGGWISGVIYLKVVPSLGNDEGAIEFSLNSEYYHDPSSLKLILQPEVGDIVLFPSSLHHRTIPFTTESERIIISFDLIPIKPIL